MSRSRRCGAQHRVGGVSPFFYFEKSKLIEPVDQKAVFFNQGGIVGGMTVGNRDGGGKTPKNTPVCAEIKECLVHSLSILNFL